MDSAQPFGDPEQQLRQVLLENIKRAREEQRWQPLPHQIPPAGVWRGWLLLAGRGAGKTEACAHYMVEHVNGPPCIPGPVPHWMAIIAPTLGDAATACFQGPSGIRHFDPNADMKALLGGQVIRWPNGSQAKMYGCREPDDVERLRAGGNTCLVWVEEMAAWRYLQEAFDQMSFGLREGPHPHWIGSTTPKPRPLIKKLMLKQYRGIEITHATMYDNPYLDEGVRDDLEAAYSGTTLGSQELYGRLVEQDEDALWTRDNIKANRVSTVPLDLVKIVVGVDPSGGAGEQGIVVDGWAPQTVIDEKTNQPKIVKHGYTLDDRTVCGKPDVWGRAAMNAAIDWEADCVVVETNFGGDMALSTLTTVAENMGISIPIRTVHASRGKAPRAQPVSAMSVQGRWHMVGEHPELEDQMCTWPPGAKWSPDRIDAMVWPAWYMKLVSTVFRSPGSFGGMGMVHRTLTRRRA